MLLGQKPSLMLVDEPVAGLTDEETELTADLLKSLAGKNTVVVIDHDMEFIRRLDSDVTVLNQGSVLCEGKMEKIQNDPKQAAVVGTEKLRARKDKLEKDYADFKSKDKIAASKEFEKDLAAEADLTKGQIKKVHKMADELPKKDFKDRYGKEKGDAVRYATATNIVKKKEGIKEMQQIDEKIKGIQTKSDKSGIPYGILKQVYNRGMAAWKGGHRPGTTPQQWAMARVNAFITKGKAYYTADADLAKKARAAKKGK